MSAESAEARLQEQASRGEAHPTRVRIEPARGWVPLELADLWRARELVYFLTWRDIKVRYKQSVLGVGWAVIQPLTNMLFFTLLFGHLARLPSDGVPYPVFTFAALLPWTYFAYVLQQGGNSLVANANMVSKVYFPRLLLPLSAALAGLLDFGIAFVVLGVMMAAYGIHPGPQVVFLPLFLLLAVGVSLGAGIGLAALSAEYRDVKYVLPFLTQIWLYASPVAYSSHLVSGKLSIVYALNPMAAVVEGFRWCLIGSPAPGWHVLAAMAVTVLLLAGSLIYFRRMEETFADVI